MAVQRQPGFPNQAALLEAIRTNSPEEVRYVLNKGGVDLNPAGSPLKEHPLDIAASGKSAEIVAMLFEGGANVHISYKVIKALDNDQLDIAQVFLDYGLDVNEQDVFGATCLHYAARDSARISTVKWLLDHGADKMRKNYNGETAEDVARAAGSRDLANFIRTYSSPKAGGRSQRSPPSATSTVRNSPGRSSMMPTRIDFGQLSAGTSALNDSTTRYSPLNVSVSGGRSPSSPSAEREKITRLELDLEKTRHDIAHVSEVLDRTRAVTEMENMRLQQMDARSRRLLRRQFACQATWHAPLLKLQRDLRRTKLEDFTLLTSIGRSVSNPRGTYGACGRVYLIRWNNTPLVLKALINPYGAQAADSITLEQVFKREYDLPCALHPCIMPALHWFKDSPAGLPEFPPPLDAPVPGSEPPRTVFVVTAAYDDNLLATNRMRRDADHVNGAWLLSVLCPMLRGVQHLVRHNVLHMDLKLDNVLVRNGLFDGTAASGVSPLLEVVLADFGCFVQVDDIMAVPLIATRDREGNPAHRAPEFRFDGRVLDMSRADVWAVAVMMHELVSGASPFEGQSRESTTYVVSEKHALPHAERWPLLARLVRAMLVCAPSDRISVEEALLLAHALLYDAPLLTTDVEQGASYRTLEDWRDGRVTQLLSEISIPQGGAAATADGAAVTATRANLNAGVAGETPRWMAEAEYLCTLDVRMLDAAARQWLIDVS